MAANIRNAESAILGGTAKANRFWRNFEARWNEPATADALAGALKSLPENVRAQLEAKAPGELAKALKQLGAEEG